MERVYNYEPVPAELTPEEGKHIVGVQANLWTEYIPHLLAGAVYGASAYGRSERRYSGPMPPRTTRHLPPECPQLIEQYKANGYNSPVISLTWKVL